MRNHQSSSSLCTLLLGWAAIMHVPAIAQTGGKPRDVVIETNRQEMDSLLLRKPILTARDLSVRMATLKQIGEDFREMQVLNNKMMEKATSSERVDYKHIGNLLGQIGARAERLKTNLALPVPPPEKDKPIGIEVTDADQFQSELRKLDKTVVSFANNPIFQKVKVIEVRFAQLANSDLAIIIELSTRLKRAATKLNKTYRK